MARQTSIRRRQFFRHIIRNMLAAGFGMASPPARAWQSFKMSRMTAGYTEREKNATQICAACLYFNVPDECMIVEGKVSPYGWCLYYYD